MELFSLRKNHRICPWHRGPSPQVSAHGSTNFIKRWPLATGSTIRIKSSESVSRLLISVVHHRSDGRGGWIRLGAAWARACGGASRPTRVRVFLTYGGRFSMRFAPTGSQQRGQRAATEPGNGEAARPVLGDGDCGLRWFFGSKDVRQDFLELPSSFSTDQLLRMAAENLNLVAT
jgi:hypothetical protein